MYYAWHLCCFFFPFPLQIRRTELDKLKEARKKEFVAEERKAREELGAAPTGE